MSTEPSSGFTTPGDYERKVGERLAAERELHRSAGDGQQGGDHYKNMAIDPMTYIMANNIPWCEGDIIKYVTRHRDKNGVEDLRKARHLLDVLITRGEAGL